MKTHCCLAGIVLLLALGVGRAQQPPATGNSGPLAPANDLPPAARTGPGADADEHLDGGIRPDGGQPTGAGAGPPVYGPGLSDWIDYPRSCDCCGPVGKHGPIGSEFYTRAGVSFLTGGGLVGDNGRPGFMVGGGLRTLFYNRPDAAWVVDLGLNSSWHDIIGSPPTVVRNVDVLVTGQNNQQQRVNTPAVTVIASSVHYLLATASFGREAYLWGAPDCGEESRCRVGWDVGGAWGSSKMIAAPTSLPAGQAFRHRTDVVGGLLLSLHGDVEYPTGCCVLFVGGRVEYGAIWSDVLQRQNDTDVQMINVLFNAGVRF